MANSLFRTVGRDHIFFHNFDERPNSAFIQIVDGGNTELVSAGTLADIDPVNTVLTVGPSRLDTSVVLSASANITSSYRYLLTQPNEMVEVDYITGSTCFLKYPLMYSHRSGSAFQGTRVSYLLSASRTTGSVSKDNCVAIFTWVKNGLSMSSDGRQEFHLCLRSPQSTLQPMDLMTLEPQLAQFIGQVDVNKVIEEAFDDLLRMLSVGGVSPGDLWSNSVLNRAHAFLALSKISLSYGQSFGPEKDQWYRKFLSEFKLLTDVAAVDSDRNSAVVDESDKFQTWTIVRG
jgi:hypothetical protein